MSKYKYFFLGSLFLILAIGLALYFGRADTMIESLSVGFLASKLLKTFIG